MKPIKIVYSWIGPRGPIWNTEPPNILSYAAVGTHTNTTTQRFWADDSWNRLFNNRRPECELHPATVIEDDDVFIYPYSLAWRIPMESYFFHDAGIIEYSLCPEHIIHQVRMNGGYFLIDLSIEAFVQPNQLMAITSYFQNLRIPLDKVIYLTGCMNADVVYEKWCTRNNIANDRWNRMHLISYPIGKQMFADQATDMPEPIYDESKIPEKLFLMWNRRFKSHRNIFVVALDKQGLLDRSYVSMGLFHPEVHSQHFTHFTQHHMSLSLGITPDDVNNTVAKLPLVLDGETDLRRMCRDPDQATRHYYQNSLVSIITETNYDSEELALTEKSFKPTKEKHPFIIIAVPGALKKMRELGFKTFSEFWDESYDDIEDHTQRICAIANTCRSIGQWSPAQILEFKQKVKPILEHNFEMSKVKPSTYVVDKIFEILRKKISN